MSVSMYRWVCSMHTYVCNLYMRMQPRNTVYFTFRLLLTSFDTFQCAKSRLKHKPLLGLHSKIFSHFSMQTDETYCRFSTETKYQHVIIKTLFFCVQHNHSFSLTSLLLNILQQTPCSVVVVPLSWITDWFVPKCLLICLNSQYQQFSVFILTLKFGSNVWLAIFQRHTLIFKFAVS